MRRIDIHVSSNTWWGLFWIVMSIFFVVLCVVGAWTESSKSRYQPGSDACNGYTKIQYKEGDAPQGCYK